MSHSRIPKLYRQEMINFYEEKIKELEETKQYFLKELAILKGENSSPPIKHTTESVNKANELFSSDENTNTKQHDAELVLTATNTSEYNKSWDWTRKIAFIFNKEKRILRSLDITNIMIGFEPELKDKSDDKEFPRKSISATLSRKSKDGLIFFKYIKASSGDQYYGLRKWLDENGNLKDEYK